MTTQLLNFSANERLDLGEISYLGQDQPTALMSSVLGGFNTKATRDQGLYILHGFGAQAGAGTSSSPAQNQVLVSPGSGILAWRRDAGTPRFGVMADLDGTDQAAQSADLTFFPAGAYVIWLRMNFTPSNATDRTFWASGDPGREYASLVPVRLVATWEIQALATGSSPGAEWVAIAKFTWAAPSVQGGAGTITALQDTRPLYFEGQASATPTFASGWGSGNDRSSDRGQYGIQDLRTMVSALRQCLEDVKGPGLRRWYDPTLGGLNVGFGPNAPVEGRVALGDAGFYLQGRTSATAGHAYLTANVDGSGNATGFDFLSDRTRFQVLGQIVTSWSKDRTVGFGFMAEANLAVSPGRSLVEHVVSAPGQLGLRLGTRAVNNASPAGLDALAYLCAPDQSGNLAQILFGKGDIQGPEQVLYRVGKGANNNFHIYDSLNAATVVDYSATSRSMILSGGNFTVYDVVSSFNVLKYDSALKSVTVIPPVVVQGTLSAQTNLTVQTTASFSGYATMNAGARITGNLGVTRIDVDERIGSPIFDTGNGSLRSTGVMVPMLAQTPSSPPFGAMYYDTADGKMYFYTKDKFDKNDSGDNNRGRGWRQL